MSIKIVRGVESSAAKVTLYGTEGIGKTTIASEFPAPIILDTEDGARRIDCAKVKCPDWKTLYESLIDLGGNAQGFKTVVIDSVDWAEQLLKKHLEVKLGKPVDDMPYGRGYGVLAEAFTPLLAACDVIVSRGVNVLLVGHSIIRRCTPPDVEEGYDRFELKLSKQVGPLVKEWSDALLFANYKTRIVEGKDGKNRGRGGRDRVIYAERCAAWDAKNRYGLAAELPMTIDALAPLFAQPKGWLQRVQEAESVSDLGAIADEADVALSSGVLSNAQHGKLRRAIDARHNELEPQEVSA